MLFNMNIFSSFDMNCFTLNLFFFFNMLIFISFKMNFSSFNFLNLNFMKEFFFMVFSSMKFSKINKMKKIYKMKKFINPLIMFASMNMVSLMFFSFSLTSLFQLNLSFILMGWMSSMIFSIHKNSSFFYHLCPLDCPLILSYLMVLIELMSLMIQPLTLFLRLTINMISGHILMMMMSNLFFLSFKTMIISFMTMTLLMLLKMMVSLIQSYILTILLMMYHMNNNEMI